MNGLSLFLVCLILTIYVVIGGVIFHFLEQQTEENSEINLLQLKREYLQNFTCMSEKDLESFAQAVITAYDNGVFTNGNKTSGNNWDYNSAIFFATTVVTTIGYGHISPITRGGRVFCIFFALLGIPLFLIAAGGVGEKIFRLTERFNAKINYKHSEHHPKITKAVCTAALCLISFILFMLIPAAVFSSIEDWDYGESVYFCFVTLTTIGFGDYVPGGSYDFASRGWYRLCVSAWILIGLAWMASIIAQSQGLFESAVQKREAKPTDNEAFSLNEESVQADYGAGGSKQ